jgi:hypothetical protein
MRLVKLGELSYGIVLLGENDLVGELIRGSLNVGTKNCHCLSLDDLFNFDVVKSQDLTSFPNFDVFS